MGSADGESKRSGHPEEQFGPQLAIVKDLNIGPCMDVAVAGARMYVIGHGSLFVADISDSKAPKVVGKLADLGNTRQIEVQNNIAYITAREDGMFIVDVSHPETPRLVCHYDTIEVATGIALSGPVAFVACRTYGVELVDVSDPARPVHLSTVRTGEAQSCIARDGILYVGVWGTRELVICDVKNPRKPVIIAKAPLDGYGDGVDVRGKHCYVATGHHARGLKKHDDESDPAYGRGHGLEIFDVSDPSKPLFVSRIKMPRFYSIGMDMWGVKVEGRYAFVADTFNGVFVVDVSDPAKPSFVAHKQLDYVSEEARGRIGAKIEPKVIAKTGKNSFVGGIALGKGCVYVAGGYSDLHVVDAEGLAVPHTPEPDHAPAIPPKDEARDPRFRIYDPGGQVYAVAFSDDVALVAAGSAGLHEVRLWPNIEKQREYTTAGFAMDVKALGPRVFVAEGKGGLSIWEREKSGALERVGCYRTPGYSAKQVVVPPPGRYALLHVGASFLHIVDVSDPTQPRLVLKDSHLGLLYGYQIAEGLLDGRYACCGWHASGYYWYDLYGGPAPVFSGDMYNVRFDARNGMALLGNRALVVSRGKYFLLDRTETRPPEDLPNYGIAGHQIAGKPNIFGNRLYVSDRFWGNVSVVDISVPEQPKLLRSYQLEGNPGIPVERKDTLIIPGGYQGLLVETGGSR